MHFYIVDFEHTYGGVGVEDVSVQFAAEDKELEFFSDPEDVMAGLCRSKYLINHSGFTVITEAEFNTIKESWDALWAEQNEVG